MNIRTYALAGLAALVLVAFAPAPTNALTVECEANTHPDYLEAGCGAHNIRNGSSYGTCITLAYDVLYGNQYECMPPGF